MNPFNVSYEIESMYIDFKGERIVRRYMDIKDIFARIDPKLENENPIIYEVFEAPVPREAGHLMFLITVIYPGKVVDEFYMTKGHYHIIEDLAEVYLGIKGKGLVLCQTKSGEFYVEKLGWNKAVYIPPRWAHRTVNISDEPLVFFAVYPAHAGHDYKTIEETGFKKRVFYKDGEVIIK